MLDPKLLRDHPDAVKEAARVKRVGSPELVDGWLAADDKRRAAQTQADALKADQNKLGPEIAKLKKELKGGTDDRVTTLLARTNEIKAQQQAAAQLQTEAEAEAAAIMLQLPAVPDPTWPIGNDAGQNVVVRTWADPNHPPLKIEGARKGHVELGEKIGILDFGRGVKLAGSRSYVARGDGALLYNAVLRYAMDVLVSRGYEPFVVPVMVTEQCMIGTGYFPAGKEQAYVTQDNTVLVGTSEVPLASFHGDEILKEEELPKRYTALSTCFRREAGAAGKDTAGLYRVHQFDKVEQVIIHKADDAEHIKLHEEIIANSEFILQQLKLPYRVVQNCTGDMGQGKWRMYDIETWMPSRNAYGETHSGSALRDFQARRLNLKYRPAGATKVGPVFCYTLNNTAIACPRVLIAIIEQYQAVDETIAVPDVLRPYLSGKQRIGI